MSTLILTSGHRQEGVNQRFHFFVNIISEYQCQTIAKVFGNRPMPFAITFAITHKRQSLYCSQSSLKWHNFHLNVPNLRCTANGNGQSLVTIRQFEWQTERQREKKGGKGEVWGVEEERKIRMRKEGAKLWNRSSRSFHLAVCQSTCSKGWSPEWQTPFNRRGQVCCSQQRETDSERQREEVQQERVDG